MNNKAIEICRFMKIHNNDNNKDYRILNISSEAVSIICLNNPSRIDISLCGTKELRNLILSGRVEIIEEPKNNTIIDTETLSDNVKLKYLRNKAIIDVVNAEYAPDYIGLTRKCKPLLREVIKRSQLTPKSVRKIIIRYLQSGCKEIGLLRRERTDNTKDQTTTCKRGRVSEIPDHNGKILTDNDRDIMTKYMHIYLSNQLITKKKCYDDMIIEHYTEESFDGERYAYKEFPPEQRPTLDQFIYHIRTHTTKEQRMESKLGRREFRNQKRLLTGTSLNGVTGPASIVEMDACELDVSVVSSTDRKKAVGSPVVYFMIDLYSRLILAASISFDNNSILAMTNCLASLVEDKEALLESLGLTITPSASGITLADAMPQNILPKAIRFDHGSDFISKQAQRIGQQLNVEFQYAPPGTGSLKGVVERSFRSFQSYFIDLVFKTGAKNHDALAKPNKEAKLTIEDVKFLMYSFILQYNTTQHESSYHLPPDMVRNGVGHVPAEVWRYGVQHAENPAYITDKDQFLFSLLIPVSAKLRRDGINYKKLRFIPDLNNDSSIRNKMLYARNASVPFTIYIDLRNVGQVYYLDDRQKLQTAKLVEDINHKEIANMTWPDFEKFLKAEKQLAAEKEGDTGRTRRAHRRIEKTVVADAKSRKGKTSDKDMKTTRAEERTRVTTELAFNKRFGLGSQNDTSPEIETKPEPVEKPVDLKSMTEAELEAFREQQIAALRDWEEE